MSATQKTIRVRLRAFALIRQVLGTGELEVELPSGATVQSLLERLTIDYPGLDHFLGQIVATVNQTYAGRTHVLADGDEVAIFPPVSGGQEDTFVALSAEPIDVATLMARVAEPGAGAVVTFAGIVRGHSLGRPVDYLEYEAYPEMALARLRQVVAEARERWPRIRRVALVHRVGHLDLGQVATVIAVAAPHRDDGAFEAARFAIDRIKEIVPIWKKEGWSDGAEWLVGDYQPAPGE